MKEFTEYILQFGDLNKQQTDLIISKSNTLELQKTNIFPKPEKFQNTLGLFLMVSFASVISTIKVKTSPITSLMRIILSQTILDLKFKQ